MEFIKKWSWAIILVLALAGVYFQYDTWQRSKADCGCNDDPPGPIT